MPASWKRAELIRAFLSRLAMTVTTPDAPGFGPDRDGGAARVIDDNGKKGDANEAVIKQLIAHDKLLHAVV